MGNVVWKVLGTGSAILAGIVATKVADQIWKGTGQERVDPHNPNAPLYTALAYAALTGLAVGVARTFTERKAAQYYAKSTGHLPEAMRHYDED